MRETLKIKVFLKKDIRYPGSYFWPGNSQDMNPIAKCLRIIKNWSCKKNPRTKNELKRVLEKKWDEQRKNRIHLEFIKSFGKRIMDLKKKTNIKIQNIELYILFVIIYVILLFFDLFVI